MAILNFIRRRKTIGGRVNPIGPRSCYDEGKRCAETLFFDYWRQFRLEIKVVRIFNTYGPRMRPDDGRVVSNFITQALTNDPITIYGDGSQTRSFCYVTDLIDGWIAMMSTPKDVIGPINLGDPGELTMRQLAEIVIDLTGSRLVIEHLPLPTDDPRQRRPDISQAKAVLGWEPKVLGHAKRHDAGSGVRYLDCAGVIEVDQAEIARAQLRDIGEQSLVCL